MASQTKTGKAFEYAILLEFYNRLNPIKGNNVVIIKKAPYWTAKDCFNSFSEKEQEIYLLNASAAINFLVDVEPRLSVSMEENDILELEILPDKAGQAGDVRDILAIRLVQKWEIGVSAKNNHKAVKHSRLSNKIDFGKKWFGIPCSKEYFSKVNPIFENLAKLRQEDKNIKWSSIPNMHDQVYVPILTAFKTELMRLAKAYPKDVPRKLVEYLIGNKDFYKVIKGKNGVEIQAYNLHGSLNLAINSIKPKAKIPSLKLPNRLIETVFKDDSKNTLIVALNEGWQISFRVHNASSRVEPSLKFDINLISTPQTLFTQHLLHHWAD